MANTTMMVYDPETQNHYRIQLVDTGSTDSHGNPIYQIGIDATAGGGGGAVSLPANAVAAGAYKVGALVDGADTTLGAKADAPNTDNTGPWSIVSVLKGIWGRLRGGQQTSANSLPVVLPSDQTVPVSGTFWQATQPVSGSVAASTVGSASFSGAGTQAATGGGAALNSGTSLACNEVLVQNDPGSTANLKVGSSTAQPIVLTAGQSINFHVTNVNTIYITSTGTATANWLARS